MRKLITKGLSIEEQLLWKRVNELWQCSVDQDFDTIEKAIHPKYIGWDNDTLLPHNRSYLVRSITDNTHDLLEYKLYPLGITVYNKHVGIANYRFCAEISDTLKNVRAIKGRCTEIFIQQDQDWILIGVHGGPEPLELISATEIY
ncbi:MAG: DUF4440 domain-containing protein [Balneolaceae bacterium]|jgi:hypothetical protein